MIKRVNYDAIAPAFDERYRRNRFEGIRAALANFVGNGMPRLVEIGCGTGHWLTEVRGSTSVAVGVDPSEGMLKKAVTSAPSALFVRGSAEALPLQDGSFDRVVCVNALHHFGDPQHFTTEAFRVSRPGGGFLTIGLDPHTGLDRWWIYEYFPEALIADQRRYPSTARIRAWLKKAGFEAVSTEVSHHIPAELAFDAALEQGLLDRRSTSQLQVIHEDHWEAGIAKLRRERPILRADLRLYATVAWRPLAILAGA